MPLFGALNLSLIHPKLLLIIFFLLTPSQSHVERRPGSCTSDLETQLVCSPSPHGVMLGCHTRTACGKTNTWQNKHPLGTLPLCLSAQTPAGQENKIVSVDQCLLAKEFRRAVMLGGKAETCSSMLLSKPYAKNWQKQYAKNLSQTTGFRPSVAGRE